MFELPLTSRKKWVISVWPSVWVVGGSSEVMGVEVILNFNEVKTVDVLPCL